eukprot:402855-Ditylum_brightwellii.AAC.1
MGHVPSAASFSTRTLSWGLMTSLASAIDAGSTSGCGRLYSSPPSPVKANSLPSISLVTPTPLQP